MPPAAHLQRFLSHVQLFQNRASQAAKREALLRQAAGEESEEDYFDTEAVAELGAASRSVTAAAVVSASEAAGAFDAEADDDFVVEVRVTSTREPLPSSYICLTALAGFCS